MPTRSSSRSGSSGRAASPRCSRSSSRGASSTPSSRRPTSSSTYVRAAPEACHRLGVPFFVAQKETTISPETMESHAERVRRYAPPIADRMTVCSERHRQFWLRSGADPAAVEVTGQPRFDFYAGLGPERTDAGYGRAGPSLCSSPTRSTPTTRATERARRSGRSSTARRRRGSSPWPSAVGAS